MYEYICYGKLQTEISKTIKLNIYCRLFKILGNLANQNIALFIDNIECYKILLNK